MEREKYIITNKGITLIALVITIIVLLILAGISIQTLTEETGIINKTFETSFRTEVAQYIEELEIKKQEEALLNDDYDSKSINARTYSEIKKYIPDFKRQYEGVFFIEDGELVISRNNTNENYNNWFNGNKEKDGYIVKGNNYEIFAADDLDSSNTISKGDEISLNLGGTVGTKKYKILKNNGNKIHVIMLENWDEKIPFSDDNYSKNNVYKNSYVDGRLQNNSQKCFLTSMDTEKRLAIIPTNITQEKRSLDDIDVIIETREVGERYIFAPSIQEIIDYYDGDSNCIIGNTFGNDFNVNESFWLRDARLGVTEDDGSYDAWWGADGKGAFYYHGEKRLAFMYNSLVWVNAVECRPSFVIDLDLLG